MERSVGTGSDGLAVPFAPVAPPHHDRPVSGWRVVIVSQVGPAIASLSAGLRAAGHEPVAVVATRWGADSAKGGDFFLRVFREAPPELDVVIPADRSRIAPLLASLAPDLIVCSGFGWLLPRDVLELPRLGAINLHPALLPRWRGPWPIAWTIRAGDDEFGMTVHRMDETFDTGHLLAQARAPTGEYWSWKELFPTLKELEAMTLPRALERVAAGDPGDPQSEAGATYAALFEEDYVRVDWGRPVDEVLRQLRAWQFCGPTPSGRGPLTELDGRTVRIVRASRDPAAGTPVDCADGQVSIVETEPAE
jgi:methionyl-tRNA formyltransferase